MTKFFTQRIFYLSKVLPGNDEEGIELVVLTLITYLVDYYLIRLNYECACVGYCSA